MKKYSSCTLEKAQHEHPAVSIADNVWYLPEYHLFVESETCPGVPDIQDVVTAHQLVPIRERYKQSIRDHPQLLYDQTLLLQNLRTVTIEVTDACDLGCRHCYRYGSGRLPATETGNKRNISEATILERASEMFEKSCQKEITIQFIGGEPLFRKHLICRVVPLLRKMGATKDIKVDFQIITNGTLLDEQTIAFFDAENVEILLSLEGPHDIQNRLRPFRNGMPSADIVLNNVAGHESKIAVIFLLCQQTRNLYDQVRFFLDKGFKGISFNYAYTEDSQTALRREDIAHIVKEIDAHEDFFVEHYSYIRNFRRIIKSLDASRSQLISCNAGRNYAALGADGQYYICQRAYGMKELSLDALRQPTSRYKVHSVEDFTPCSSCWARYICGGICWFNSWYWPESYRDIRCDFMRGLVSRVSRLWFTRIRQRKQPSVNKKGTP